MMNPRGKGVRNKPARNNLIYATEPFRCGNRCANLAIYAHSQLQCTLNNSDWMWLFVCKKA